MTNPVIHKPTETVIRDSSGHVLGRWVESDDDPCCDECVAWATGADVDEQTKRKALQAAINAAHERHEADRARLERIESPWGNR